MAQIHVDQADFASAREQLRAWQKLARLIENSYLHHFAEKIDRIVNADQQPFIIRINDDLRWDKCESDLRMWLAKAAVQRAGGPGAQGKAIAHILGINPSSWSRWPKEDKDSTKE